MDLITAQLLLQKFNIHVPVSCLTDSCLSKAANPAPDNEVLVNELKWGILLPQPHPRLYAQHVYYVKNLLEKKDYKSLIMLLFTVSGVGSKPPVINKPLEQGIVGGSGLLQPMPPLYPYVGQTEFLCVNKIIPCNNQTRIDESLQKGLLSAKIGVRYHDTSATIFKLGTKVFDTYNFEKNNNVLKKRGPLIEEMNTIAYILNSPNVSTLRQECVHAMVPSAKYAICANVANSIQNRTDMAKLEAGLEMLLAMFLNILKNIDSPDKDISSELQKELEEEIGIIDDEDEDDDDDCIIQEINTLPSVARASTPVFKPATPAAVNPPTPKMLTPKLPTPSMEPPRLPLVVEPLIVPQVAQLTYVTEQNKVIQMAYKKLNLPLQVAINAVVNMYPELASMKKVIKFHQSTVDYYQQELNKLGTQIPETPIRPRPEPRPEPLSIPQIQPLVSSEQQPSTSAASVLPSFNFFSGGSSTANINAQVEKPTKKKKKTNKPSFKTPEFIEGHNSDDSDDDLICVGDAPPSKKTFDQINFLETKNNIRSCVHTARLVKAASAFLNE
nr:ORF91 [Acipenserid herpesvirus 1]